MNILKKPTWLDAPVTETFPKLSNNKKTDVVIVGGGLAGLMSAYTLAEAGKKVVVLEMGKIGEGTTAYTTAFLMQSIDTDALQMIRMYDKANAKLVYQSHQEAIDLLENIVKKENIECEFSRVSSFEYINNENEKKDLKEEFKSVKELNPDVVLHDENALPFKQFGNIETPNQGKYHPLLFMQGLLVALQKMGVEIFEHSEVTELSGDSPVIAKNGDFTVEAEHGILATYYPLNNPIQTFAKKGMYISYVFEVQIPKAKFAEGLYTDFNNPYHYFRIDSIDEKHDRMIIGGEDNRKEIEIDKEKNFTALEEYLKELIGDAKYTITKKWDGEILETIDGLALIGEYQKNCLVATGFSGNGMTYSGISALLFRDIVLGKKNVYQELYDPKRLPNATELYNKGKDYVGEFFGGVAKNVFKKGK